jgi:hypothetical protein
MKREDGESVSDFIKRFNRIFGKIPAEIKPSDASEKITFSIAFDLDFCLILRERRSTTLALMQDSTLEVESNTATLAHKPSFLPSLHSRCFSLHCG